MPSDGVVFRTVASAAVGFGHLRRCLTLADELARRGCRAQFWIDGDDAARAVASAAGFAVQTVAGDDEPQATLRLAGAGKIAALIVDSYALDAGYFRALRPLVGCLMVIDDLADRPLLDADIVSNGSANAAELTYRTGPRCTLLLGPRYSLLRPTFRGLPVPRQRDVKRVLVTLGGSDPRRLMVTVVTALMASLPGAIFDVVVGPLFGADAVASLQQLAGAATAGAATASTATDRLVLHRAPGDLQGLMTTANLAVSGGGQTLYELAACGLPTVALCLADNQRGQLAALARQGALLLGGAPDEAGQFPDLGPAVSRLADDLSLRRRMSATGQRLVDGQGTLRVADALLLKLG